MHRRERIRRGGALLGALVFLVGLAGMGADAGALEPGESEVVFERTVPDGKTCADATWEPDDPATRSGEAKVAFASPYITVAAGTDGTVLIGDFDRVRRLTAGGDSTTIVGPPAWQMTVAGVAIDPRSEYAYVAGMTGLKVQILRVALRGSPVVTVLAEAPQKGADRLPLAVDLVGNVYIAEPAGMHADGEPPRIAKVVNGGIVSWLDLPGQGRPTSVAVTAEGSRLFVAKSDASVTEYTAGKQAVGPVALEFRPQSHVLVAVDLKGEHLFASSLLLGRGEVKQVDLNTRSVRPLAAAASFGLSVGGIDPAQVYVADVAACSIKRIMPLAPATPPTTQGQSSTTVSPTTTPTTVPTQNPPSQPVEVPKTVEAPQAIPRLEAPTAPTPASSDGGSTVVSPPSGEQQLLTGGATDGSSTSGFVPGGSVNPAPSASSGAQGGVPPSAGPPGNPVLTPDPSSFAVPEPLPLGSASPPPAAAAAPPPAAPAPPPAAPQPIAPAGSTGAPPPVPQAQAGPSAGLSAAPGANGPPPQASPRYAMVRNDDGSGAAFAVTGLFVLGGCTLLSALFLARKGGGRPDAAAAPAHAKAWGTGL